MLGYWQAEGIRSPHNAPREGPGVLDGIQCAQIRVQIYRPGRGLVQLHQLRTVSHDGVNDADIPSFRKLGLDDEGPTESFTLSHRGQFPERIVKKSFPRQHYVFL